VRRDLVASYITPVDLFFKRNHGPIPVLHDAGRCSVLYLLRTTTDRPPFYAYRRVAL
jgi:sulfite oxidase